MHIESQNNAHSSPDVIRMIKYRAVWRWRGIWHARVRKQTDARLWYEKLKETAHMENFN